MTKQHKGSANFKAPAFYNLGLLFNYQQGCGRTLEEIAHTVEYDVETVRAMITFFEQIKEMNLEVAELIHSTCLDSLSQQISTLEELLRKNMSLYN